MEKLKCKVVMLPTEKATNLIIDDNSRKLHFIKDANEAAYGHQHLYFVSNEGLVDQKFFIIDNREGMNGFIHEVSEVFLNTLRIIATTDYSLGLPLIGEAFIQKYVKVEGKIDEVLLECSLFESSERSTEVGSLALINTLSTRPKTRPDNTVIISPVKSSWSREELIDALNDSFGAGSVNRDEYRSRVMTRLGID